MINSMFGLKNILLIIENLLLVIRNGLLGKPSTRGLTMHSFGVLAKSVGGDADGGQFHSIPHSTVIS
jgi:hypothetical protein